MTGLCRSWALALAFLLAPMAADSGPHRDGDHVDAWAADHHMHLGSVDICRRLGDCIEARDPPAVLAVDAIEALDAGRVERGVVFSSGYLYALDSLGLEPQQVARETRRENEFTADQVARYPGRLTGFLSVDPLEPAALAEVRHWRGDSRLIGLKLHFAASGVDMRDAGHRDRVAAVMREAAAHEMPMVMHIGGGTFGAADAEVFIADLLPGAGCTWVQVAHAAGGYPFTDGRHVEVLDVFARHIAAGDRRTRHVLFDLSYVPAPEEDVAAVSALVVAMRKIGLERFLFGSDFNVLTPVEQISRLDRLGLTPEEYAILRSNRAPWLATGGPIHSSSSAFTSSIETVPSSE